MESKRKKITFKPYKAQSGLYLSQSLEHYVPSNHIARIINEAVDSIDLKELESSYKGGGRSNYSPVLLLKAIIYGYVNKVYSSRRIEQMMRENIIMMWLCSMEIIDHNTINNFRKGVLKDHIDKVFAYVLELLVEQGYIKLEKMHTDGTKIEANANRYTFVWGKSVSHHKGKLIEKIRGLMNTISEERQEQEQEDEELLINRPEISSSELASYIQKLNEELEKPNKEEANKTEEKSIKKKVKF